MTMAKAKTEKCRGIINKRVVQQVGVEFYVCNTVAREMDNINFPINVIWEGEGRTLFGGRGDK
jgi:hypothetical protein